MERAQAVEELQHLFSLLDEDTKLGFEYLEQYRNKFFARALVRCRFATIEGICHKMREVSLASCGIGEGIYTQREQDILRGNLPIDDKCKVKSGGNSSFLGMLCFTFSNYGKIHGVNNFSIHKRENGWSQFREALKYRHAITHPKSAEEFDLDLEEWKKVASGLGWFDSQFISLLKQCEQADQNWSSTDAVKKQLDA